jgi:hypothetical protein
MKKKREFKRFERLERVWDLEIKYLKFDMERK